MGAPRDCQGPTPRTGAKGLDRIGPLLHWHAKCYYLLFVWLA
jgi:hypothetical protein